MVIVTLVIQYSDGTSEEVPMSSQSASQLMYRHGNGELPNILKIEYKHWLTDDDTLIPPTESHS